MIQEFDYCPVDGGVEITLKSGLYTGRLAFFEGVTMRKMNAGVSRYMNRGDTVQKAFSFLSKERREFLITGIYPEEWLEIFGEEEI